MTDDRLPWSRQRGESAKAFAAFTVYRDLATTRSLLKVSQQLSKSTALLKRWSARWGWMARVEAYDADVERQTQLAFRAELLETQRRHVRALTAAQQVVLAAVRPALLALASPAFEALTSAATANAVGLRAALREARVAAAMLPALVLAERVVLGLTSERVEVEDRRSTRLDWVASDPEATEHLLSVIERMPQREDTREHGTTTTD